MVDSTSHLSASVYQCDGAGMKISAHVAPVGAGNPACGGRPGITGLSSGSTESRVRINHFHDDECWMSPTASVGNPRLGCPMDPVLGGLGSEEVQDQISPHSGVSLSTNADERAHFGVE